LFATRGCRKFATFSASSELPMTVEDSMLFWLNKSTSALHKRVGVSVPMKQLTDLCQLSDGLFLASAISFYCSSDLPFEGINPLESRGSYSATPNNIKLVHWPLMGGLLRVVYFGPSLARPLLAVQNATAHPSTTSVPITILLYNGPFLCSFNVSDG